MYVFRLAALAAIAFFAFTAEVMAQQQLPPHWPWRGVSVNTVSASPEMVAALLDKLPIKVLRFQLHACQEARVKRLPIDVAWEHSLKKISPMLQVAQQRGVVTVINVSKFCLGGDQRKAAFWTDEQEKKRIYAMIDRIIEQTSKFDRSLIAYDFFSEPLVITPSRRRLPPPDWNDYLAGIVKHVRAKDDTSWMVVSAGPGMNPVGYADLHPVSDKRVIYNVHMYLPTQFTHQGLAHIPWGVTYPGGVKGVYWDKHKLRGALDVVRDFQIKNEALVWVGEFSAVRWAEGSELYIKDLVDIFEGYGWGWAYFSASGFHGWNPNYSRHYASNQRMAADQFEGERSMRWQTLRSIFKVEQGINQ